MARADKLLLYRIAEIQNPWHYTFSRHFYEAPQRIPVHWHDYFEFEIVADGRGNHICNDTCQTIHRGSGYLLTPFDFHTVQPLDGAYPKIYNFNFNDLSLPPEILTLLSESSKTCSFDETEMAEIEREIALIEKTEKEKDSFLKHQIMGCSFYKIILLFLQKCTAENPGLCRASAFHRAVAYTQTHFRENIDLHTVAGEVGLTPNYLGQLFIRQYGIPFKGYLKNIRLKHAKNLLTHSDYSIAEIGRHSGFQTTSYFIQCFHEAFSITPRQYMMLATADKPE